VGHYGGIRVRMTKANNKFAPSFFLLRNFIVYSKFQANPEFSHEKFEVPDMDIDVSMTLVGEEQKKWNLSLTVKIKEDVDPKTFPYFFDLMMIGAFYSPVYSKIKDEEKRKKFHKILYVNGSSILYSAIREHIRTFTATGPYKPFILPTTQFLPEDAETALLEREKD
jgi:preprotein translocase subunit SecB